MSKRSSRRKAKGPNILGPVVVFGLFALVILTVGGLFLLFMGGQPAAPAAIDTELAEAEGEGRGLPEVEPTDNPLIDRVRLHRLRCGLDDVSSLTFNGSYESGGQDFSFSLVARRPDLVRQVLRMESGSRTAFTAVFDGDVVWVEVAAPGSEPEVREIDPVNRRVLRLEGNYAALAWTYDRDGGAGLSLAGEEVLDGRTCMVVENANLLDVPVRHYLGPDGYEWRREATITVDGEDSRLAVVFGEPVEEEGRLRPSSYRVRVNDEEVCSATVDSMRTNIGILPTVFERPE